MKHAKFVSERIVPARGTFDATRLARGEPGLPTSFTWRGQRHEWRAILETGKLATPEFSGELYVRRHEWTLLMDDGSTWEIYMLRQMPKSPGGTSRAARWFLKTRRDAGEENSPPPTPS